MFRLDNPVRHYAWGSGVHIPRLLGQAPDGQPWAELWMGAHPADPSLLEDGRRLDEVVAADPDGVLGEEVASAFGRFPFMMKLLAAGEPLSLQVHPSSEQARLGFADQEAAGIPIDAPARSYQDPSHKPELVYALTRFEGMAGFRDLERTVAILRELRLTWLDEMAERLEGSETPFQSLRNVVTDILSWTGPELEQRIMDLGPACEAAEARLHAPPSRRRPPTVSADSVSRESLRVFQQTQPLAKRYPTDPGVIVTLLLNHVVLAAGEAMFVPAGVMHAYTSGFGVEIMASSDNVMRAGLTPKYVDIPELLRITDFRPTPPPQWAARDESEGVRVYAPPVAEFELTVLTSVREARIGSGPAMVLVLSGEALVSQADQNSALTAGNSVLVSGADIVIRASRARVAVGRCPLG